MKLGHQELDFSKPVVMGILNVTTDSFYDGGKYLSEIKVIGRIHQIIDEGAGIIDDTDKLGNNAFIYFAGAFFFNTSDTVGFDENLICDRGGT